jgi:acyl-CoA dehydrogenase
MDDDLFDDDHQAFRGSVRKLLATRPGPGVDERGALSAAGADGFLGVTLPESLGGGGVDDPRFTVVLGEEMMSAGHTALAFRAGVHAWVVAPALMHHATAAQQDRWLPGLASGERTVALVGLGVDGAISSRSADSGLVLSGTSRAVAGGADADLLLVVTEDDAGRGRLAVLESGRAGVTPTPDSLGAPGMAPAHVTFCDTVVPQSDVLPTASEVGAAGQLDELRGDVDLWLAVISLAGARAALSETVAYVQDRKVFGRSLAEFDNTCDVLAGVSVSLDAASHLVATCVRSRCAGPIAPARACAAVIAATDVHARAVDEGLQLHGGYGYMREYPIAQAFADARYLLLESHRRPSAAHVVAAGLGLHPQASRDLVARLGAGHPAATS